MEFLTQLIDIIINSFDYGYCITVNLLTYFIIKLIDEINKDKEVKTWTKRIILLVCILSTGGVYLALGQDARTIINSAVLAPVAWTWILKPICKKLGIDYKQIINDKEE